MGIVKEGMLFFFFVFFVLRIPHCVSPMHLRESHTSPGGKRKTVVLSSSLLASDAPAPATSQ
jgi:hypothetical protein